MRQIYLLSVFLMVSLLSFGTNFAPTDAETVALKGNSNTVMGEYQITELPAETINGETLRKFEMSYQNGKNPVVILIDEKANCKDYIVRSKNLELKYVCKKSGFGAQLINGKLSKYDPTVNAYFLSAEELANQARISDGGLTVEQALGLIASYYPALMKHKELL